MKAELRERVLTLALKGEYFDAIRDGTKPEEFRLVTPYWTRRLEGRDYDTIVLTRGYPAAGDHDRRLKRAWRGFRKTTITHPHFGNEPVEVFAIRVDVADGPQDTTRKTNHERLRLPVHEPGR